MAQRGRHESVRSGHQPVRSWTGAAGSAGTRPLVLAALIGLLLGIGGTAVVAATRSGSSSTTSQAATPSVSRTSSAPTSSVLGAASGAVGPGVLRDCRRAVQRADAALAQARQVEGSLTQQTDIVNQLLGHRLTLPQALHTSVPLLASGSTASTQLRQADASYRAAAKLCTS